MWEYNTLSPIQSVTFSVIGSNTNNCVSANSAIGQVSVLPNPSITLPSVASICLGDSYTINPLGATSYSYSGGSNIVSPISTTLYTVTGSSSVGCLGNAVITVSVLPAITVSIIGPTVVCEGQAINLQGIGANTYTWNTGSTTSSINVSPSVSTVYSLNGSNGNCFGSSSLAVLVNLNPSLSLVSSNSVVCADESFTLLASGASTYTWSNGSTNNFIITTSSVTGNFSLVGMDANGCVNTASITQLVDPCVGLNKQELKNYFLPQVYPNPGNGEYEVNFQKFIANGRIEVYNLIGQLILREEITSSNFKFSIIHANNGVYIFKVLTSNKEVFVTKIIKQD